MSKVRIAPNQIKKLQELLALAQKDALTLRGAMYNASDNALTLERYVELVRGIAEVDYPIVRERMNWAFRGIRDLIAAPAPRSRRRPRPAGRRNRKAVAS